MPQVSSLNGVFLEGVVGAAGSHRAELGENPWKSCYVHVSGTPSNSSLTVATWPSGPVMIEDHRGLIPSSLRLRRRANNGKTLAGRACRLRLPMDGKGASQISNTFGSLYLVNWTMGQAGGCKLAQFVLEAGSSHAPSVTFPSDKHASRKAVIIHPENLSG